MKIKVKYINVIGNIPQMSYRTFTDIKSFNKFKNKYKNDIVYVKKEDTADYKKAFFILMDYFDSLPDEEKPIIDKKLKRCGL